MISGMLTVHEDAAGRIWLVGAWQERIRVTGSLIGNARFGSMWRDGDILHFKLANGRAAYRIVAQDQARDELTCELQYSEYEAAPTHVVDR